MAQTCKMWARLGGLAQWCGLCPVYSFPVIPDTWDREGGTWQRFWIPLGSLLTLSTVLPLRHGDPKLMTRYHLITVHLICDIFKVWGFFFPDISVWRSLFIQFYPQIRKTLMWECPSYLNLVFLLWPYFWLLFSLLIYPSAIPHTCSHAAS